MNTIGSYSISLCIYVRTTIHHQRQCINNKMNDNNHKSVRHTDRWCRPLELSIPFIVCHSIHSYTHTYTITVNVSMYHVSLCRCCCLFINIYDQYEYVVAVSFVPFFVRSLMSKLFFPFLQQEHAQSHNSNGNGVGDATNTTTTSMRIAKIDEMVSPWLVSSDVVTTPTAKPPIMRKTVVTQL